MAAVQKIGGSFRDPSGFTFVADGLVFRQVNKCYSQDYDLLLDSGLYDNLTDSRLLIPHGETNELPPIDDHAYKIIQPKQIPFISHPYEWCFSQLKDAALATLEIQKRALTHGLTLKDASAYNIQFLEGRPVLIDTLSFERYQEGEPWIAYRQFCQHFLAPLALASLKDIRLGLLSKIWLDGVPLDLAASLLPPMTWLNLGLTMHLRLHSRAQLRHADQSLDDKAAATKRLSMKSLQNIIDSLRSAVGNLRWDQRTTDWASYYDGDSYQDEEFTTKRNAVAEYLAIAKPKCVWDLGANAGVFSRLAIEAGAFVVSVDSDAGVVEANYLEMKRRKEGDLHPLLVDLSNPSASIGWANEERDSLFDRCNADCIMALALVHHLAIANNVPLSRIAETLASIGQWLIVEFVPKADKQVQKLLASRRDIFDEYTPSGFQCAFGAHYEILQSRQISASGRRLFLMRRLPGVS